MIARLYQKLFFRDRLFCVTTILALIFHSALLASIVRIMPILREDGQAFIALHTRVFYGIDFIGEPYLIGLLPVLGLATLVINYGLARRSYGVSRFVLGTLSVISVLMQLFLIFAAFLIYQLNLY